MSRLRLNVHKRLQRGEIPVVYVIIETHMGNRVYAEKELAAVFDAAARIADGTYTADGTYLAGGDSLGVLEKSARVLSYGSFERTIQPKKNDVLSAYGGKQLQHISLELANADAYFSKLIAQEPFIGRPISIYVGFESEPQATHLSLFKGVIAEMSVMPTLTIEADER